jgi:hypothetical protein
MRTFGPFSARMDLSLSFPRIHDADSEVGKVFGVSGCQLRAAGVEFLATFRVVTLSRAIAWRAVALQSSLSGRHGEMTRGSQRRRYLMKPP